MAPHGDCAYMISVGNSQATERGTTKRMRFFQDGVEHWYQIAGRGIDDLQNLSGRGLLLQGLVTLGVALGKFSLTLGKLTLQIGYKLLGIG